MLVLVGEGGRAVLLLLVLLCKVGRVSLCSPGCSLTIELPASTPSAGMTLACSSVASSPVPFRVRSLCHKRGERSKQQKQAALLNQDQRQLGRQMASGVTSSSKNEDAFPRMRAPSLHLVAVPQKPQGLTASMSIKEVKHMNDK